MKPTPTESGVGGRCANCGSTEDFQDVCDECRKEFGDLCKTDANGYNCTCQNCGNNTYNTQCLTCGHDEWAGAGKEDSDSEPGHSPSVRVSVNHSMKTKLKKQKAPSKRTAKQFARRAGSETTPANSPCMEGQGLVSHDVVLIETPRGPRWKCRVCARTLE